MDCPENRMIDARNYLGLWSLAAVLITVLAAPAQAAPRVVDPAKSQIGFQVKQMGVDVSGRFTRFSGSVELDPAQPASSSARIEVEIASLTTGEAEADAVALEDAWLNQPAFPKATFESKQLKALGGNRYEASGTLTIRGKARPLTVPLTIDSHKDGSLGVAGTFQLNRTDFGIGGGEWNDSDLVANAVPVTFRLHLINKP